MTTAVRRRLIPTAWRNPINRVLNLALYILSCGMVGTGLLLWIRLPPGSAHRRQGGSGAETILGLTRHGWGDWHLYTGLALIALGILHLLMNWTWMRKIAAGAHAWKLWAGLAAGAAIIVFFMLVPAS